ncbi:hypothetical protein BDP27DRAFT_1350000 [Rhodocollybia butyracea]|uniref:Uncharacterized protein n=1 Tax=Rhodocollybia butyracea TaxID=206335 RepID=A0A9P5P550_9AGAR|nr:hypothetical protein BDP27DRAFT_1350000 [Rhodocollybia butyracea]
MRFAPLLFLLVASSMLSVPVGPRIQPRRNRNRPPKSYLATVTFIDGYTGTVRHSVVHSAKWGEQIKKTFTKTLGDISGLKLAGQVDYKGLYGPVSSTDKRHWGYFIIIGVPVECTVTDPCFGWIARGDIDASLPLGPVSPGRNRFKEIMGRPVFKEGETQRQHEYIEAKQNDWDNLSHEFNSCFMVATAGIVTFTDIKGAHLGTGDTTTFSSQESMAEESMTAALNALDNTEAEITYKGSYIPLNDKRQWVIFKNTRLPVECTDAKPCFGFIATGARFNDDGRIPLPDGKHNKPVQLYVAISKGVPGRDHFEPFQGEPKAAGVKGDKMRTEWKAILAEFRSLYVPAAA